MALALALTLQASVPAQDPDVAALTRLEALWNDAHMRGDAVALDQLWADELVAVVPRMAPLPKQDALAFVRSARMKFLRYESSDVTVKVYDNSAVARGRLLRARELGGQTIQDNWRFTKVYVRQGGQWRVVAFHASEAGS
ncbi:MAG: nuclear transport factor 2 family protein [Vicinamibacteria bacterium]|nr:nuclear transport factor 2 family protein [Vicinamibacteria bacterium]